MNRFVWGRAGDAGVGRRQALQVAMLRLQDSLIDPRADRHSGRPRRIACEIAGLAVDPLDAP